MNVFCDLHHYDLYCGLQLLFEKRLGFKMYRPIGLDWYTEGYWKVFDHPTTAQQFLSTDQGSSLSVGLSGDILPSVNKEYTVKDGIYYVADTSKDDVFQRAVTLDKFKDMRFDIVISSIPQHIPIYNQLISLYQPQAKHIFQVGNSWGHQPTVKNILASTSPFPVPLDVNIVFYHQEFDLGMFSYEAPTNASQVSSFIHYMRNPETLNLYKSTLSDWKFFTYGAGMEKCLYKTSDVANVMKNSGWTWHWKPEGDGFGFIVHNSFACGRPLIVNKNHYKGKLAESLLEDQVTCIDISTRSIRDNCLLLRKYSQPEEHQAICKRVKQRFDQVVNYDQEEQNIRQFIGNLK